MPYSDKPLLYPPSLQVDQIDKYNGVQIPDPLTDSKTGLGRNKGLGLKPKIKSLATSTEIPVRSQIKQRLA